MAKRKRRRPSAGPPPARSPKRVAEAGDSGSSKARPARRRPGEPIPPSFRGVAIRAVLVAVLFFPYLIYVAGESVGVALSISAIAAALAIPLGMLLDRLRYRSQLRRLERARAR